ncbi:hypothetical protein M427DRAFT_210919 [Gonapodya prolifera JEL478]|uniref:Uncharacterized protein n=1 Tax=Gonapodya prolifera (strain JEL478) TaxID=1344416 RepID=A0A139ANY3_GONPJ|nr:hypothetical protein M427DRAFT_210919 [Gonapodya prolifera JEL478]|eukprot:KXS18459.1 hypothetical protein M427DRAFT_210919 [Gonapodya prolifera JEL478]
MADASEEDEEPLHFPTIDELETGFSAKHVDYLSSLEDALNGFAPTPIPLLKRTGSSTSVASSRYAPSRGPSRPTTPISVTSTAPSFQPRAGSPIDSHVEYEESLPFTEGPQEESQFGPRQQYAASAAVLYIHGLMLPDKVHILNRTVLSCLLRHVRRYTLHNVASASIDYSSLLYQNQVEANERIRSSGGGWGNPGFVNGHPSSAPSSMFARWMENGFGTSWLLSKVDTALRQPLMYMLSTFFRFHSDAIQREHIYGLICDAVRHLALQCRLTDVPLSPTAAQSSGPSLSSHEEDDSQNIPLMVVAYSMGSSISTEFLSEYRHYVEWKDKNVEVAQGSRPHHGGVGPLPTSATTAEENLDVPHFQRWEERLGVAGMKLLKNCKVYITMGSPCGWQYPHRPAIRQIPDSIEWINLFYPSDILASPLANVYEENRVKDVELPFLPQSLVKRFGMGTSAARVPGSLGEDSVLPVMASWASTIQELANVIFWLDMMSTPLKWTPISHAIYPVDEGVYELIGRKVGAMLVEWEKEVVAIATSRKEEHKRKREVSRGKAKPSSDTLGTTSRPSDAATGVFFKRPVATTSSDEDDSQPDQAVSTVSDATRRDVPTSVRFTSSYLNLFNYLPNPFFFPVDSHAPYPFHLDLRPLTPSFTGPSADKENIVFLYLPGMVTGPDYEDEIANAVKGFSTLVRRISLQQERKVEAMLAVVDYTSIGDAFRHSRWEGFLSRDNGGWTWDPEEGMVWMEGTGEEGILAGNGSDSKAKGVVGAAVGAALTVQELIKGGLGVGRWRRWWRWMGLRKVVLENFAFVVSALTEAPIQYSIIEGTRSALATLTETLRHMGYTSKKPANLVVVGHSIGGFFAQMMLNRHKEVFENVRMNKHSDYRRDAFEGLTTDDSDALVSDIESDSGLSTAGSSYSVSGVSPLSPRRDSEQNGQTLFSTGTPPRPATTPGSKPFVRDPSPLTFRTIITLGSFMSWVADPAEIPMPEEMKGKWVSVFFTEDFFSGPLSPMGLQNVNGGLAAEIGIGLFEPRRSFKVSRRNPTSLGQGAVNGVGTGISGAIDRMLHKIVDSAAIANANRRQRTRSGGVRKRHKRARSRDSASVHMTQLSVPGARLARSSEVGKPSTHRARGYLLVDNHGEVVSYGSEVDDNDDELGYGYESAEGKRRGSSDARKVDPSPSLFQKAYSAASTSVSAALHIPQLVAEKVWDHLERCNEEYGLDRWTGFLRRMTGPLGEGYVNDPVVWRIVEGVVGGIIKDGTKDSTNGSPTMSRKENVTGRLDAIGKGTTSAEDNLSRNLRRSARRGSASRNTVVEQEPKPQSLSDRLFQLGLDVVAPVSAVECAAGHLLSLILLKQIPVLAPALIPAPPSLPPRSPSQAAMDRVPFAGSQLKGIGSWLWNRRAS